ncbi:GNAT family N-acetyltransferase [Idiomarina tyrosinivorans]|uniref:GNAT family N-acetyltransferase n=1 Tax=Idiomarina tyrosinivorans TaxID=1445662 RepID=A0A432ZRR8_9GAMM|nr:GNAT family N-acetyltransferase [Idiomarina tyrosinivorans]RUO80552.1 GNAT family N-acetyltransferase [Idiomarina tyrosinivorans]
MVAEVAEKLVYLGIDDLPAAASLLYQSYYDDPLFERLFEHTKPDYEKRLRAVIREDLAAYWNTEQPIIGLFDGATLKGVACLTQPGDSFGPGRYWQWRLKLLLTAGYLSTRQILEKEKAIQQALPAEHCHMLAFIAVPPRYRQQGLGDLLLAAVKTALRESPRSEGVAVYVTREDYLDFFKQRSFEKINELDVSGLAGELLWFSRERLALEGLHEL